MRKFEPQAERRAPSRAAGKVMAPRAPAAAAGVPATAYAWNPFALPGLAALAFSWALAATVFLARPARAQNRRLALLLFVEGARLGSGLGFQYLAVVHADAYGFQALALLTGALLPLLYLRFLATLETPLVAPLRGRVASALLAAAGAGVLVAFFAFPRLWIVRLTPDVAYTAWDCVCGPATTFVWIAGGVVSILGLVAAVHAWRLSPTNSAARAQSKAFAVAFGTRDALLAVFFTAFPLAYGFDSFGTNLAWDLAWIFGNALVSILFTVLVAYGILRTQLFDIDLRIKRGLRRSTVAAAFVAAFFVASESAEAFFSSRVGTALGIVAAGLLVFAIAPLQRLADRLADTAMPRVHDTDEYRTVRKREVYRAAVESALQDGVVTERERDVLATMAEKLGLGPVEARAVEREVAAASRAAAGGA